MNTVTTLPPDPEGQNDDRANYASTALLAFADMTGLNQADIDEGTALGDLLCNLMHWCDRHDVSFDDGLSTARWHYTSETGADR
jgi:hypothetical protein